ncbi:SDR family NAD(P)-dependent oxidoreductase [Verrucomicrobia bacterium S94]|nr:SDR family NAD(P)-dependent oxidoreductase [Verrucomicrobia bacterium S94]
MGISIENKVALVTGANRGIGRAIVESFINHGAEKVYLAVRRPESTAELEAQYGDKVVTIRADVADKVSIEALAKQAADVDVVVNNAGIAIPNSRVLDERAEPNLVDELQVNVFGLLNVAHAFAGILEKNNGALVQLNSVASFRDFADIATYSASKAAAYSLTQALREDLSKKGVQVVSVHPGGVVTDMAEACDVTTSTPASVVGEALVDALANGDFFVYPDPGGQMIGAAYQHFADEIVMADFS